MSQNEKEQFEQSFQTAIKASLQCGRASDGVRSRLLQSLASPPTPAPAGLDQLERFDGALARAVAGSQEWAVDDAVAWRVETALGQEAGGELLSERSMHHARGSDTAEAEPAKARFLRQLCASVEKSQMAIVAPESCRSRIESALVTAAVPSAAKVMSLPQRPARPGRSYWKRGLAAVASLAASAALVFGLFFGGAEQALAESVRQDHQRCCSALKGKQAQSCASFNSDTYGPLPNLSIAPGWVLVASKMCRDSEGQPMVHNVYNRDGKIISIHLIPPATSASSQENSQPREIANGDFPVLAWEASGWTVTACSSDVDMSMLASAVDAR